MSHRTGKPRFAFLVFAVGACALSGTAVPLVPLGSGLPSTSVELPPARRYAHRSSIRSRYDSTADQTQVAVTTHAGVYFLWIQRPRVTFLFAYRGRQLLETPRHMFVVFRTQTPQYPRAPRLEFDCRPSRWPAIESVAYEFAPDVVVNNHYLVFAIPTEQVVDVLSCPWAYLQVGGIRVTFSPDQLEALRDLASRMRPGGALP